ncbi:1-deoxy-D-xylulose-5-phosphate reductoisomerase [Sinorhizobium meliloti WSM1022]|jgi:1-deoxy-D-xylulose-5-phosphate reductoisomerase|uniref:1-deoxy-D-xylulose-5-phosphate reductoisomerase n=1 Tax=Rhizobium meliloti TaxID=382 RepID=UPI000410C62C|nr:1-deoxy-D-xylulose-5-phosphate reductoisomerase [Sinorhizobium meliloti]ASQ02706.1 1-deoxy-D-xylulose-5-phosphate reductoisomerase [Sinorhizobium meliloti]MCO6422451.1 1-deoxy-D-xylulose-5-phosphate reductoisomerase [Sinorhizobium meliloti]MDW9410989.1 1-deoxy-D-xylulose-5-phosphate reductoisomerase [Sinorhizobium meliloti]MDW9445267.1 1-deoxy-D-xylulose-5-phosphate reductoisomerase [Sinorhizobium meliloti]MDW9456456.1 1-deoxy-D-xylulose-5-phosphate reductoisomerase [Sinorhizobium meliloti]
MASGDDLKRRLTILGSTGSIGTSTLDVIERLGGRDRFEIAALTGNGNIPLLAEQARRIGAELAVTADEDRYGELKNALSGSGIEVAAGRSGLTEAAERDAGWVMAAIVGNAGLGPTLAAARRGADIALANKECLVSAGNLFIDAVAEGGGRLLPVDSEHNAIFQVLENDQRHAVERIVLTASGGPFRTKTLDEMRHVTADVARAHPNWSMGLKISIDSASMFNKALEMIEARHLFRLRPEQIEVIVHPQSVVHSMVGYTDGSVLAQLGCPDMRTAIGYALSYPKRCDLPVERLDFARLARLDFEAPDEVRFPAIKLARRAMEEGGVQGAVLNGAKETALDAFIKGRIGFLAMAEIVEKVMDGLAGLPAATSMDDVFAADERARRAAAETIR